MGPREALRQADAAIVGDLVAVVPRADGRADFRYRVRDVYKGRKAIGLGTTISVRGNTQGAACGLPSQLGHRYGLLLGRQRGRWLGGLCGMIAPRKLRFAAGGDSTRAGKRGGSKANCNS
jgi:hypothetical protein